MPAPAPAPGVAQSACRRRSVNLLLALVCAVGGCTTTTYKAEKLPNSLRIASRANPQRADLSRLAGLSASSQLIGVADVIEVTIVAGLSDEDTVRIPVRIADDGTGTLPDIGTLPLAGLELDDAEAAIHSACVQRRLFLHPHVTVTMENQRMNRVRVIGAVEEPGMYELPRTSSDLLSAIVRAGGLAQDAGENVEIRNPVNPNRPAGQESIAGGHEGGVTPASHSARTTGGMRSVRVNLVSAAMGSPDMYRVDDGGVVHVEKRDPAPIHVKGLVRKAGEIEYPIGHDLRLLEAISKAGGVSNQLANKVYVIRPLRNSPDPAVIDVSMRKATHSNKSNLRLAPGDIVSVQKTPATVLLDVVQIFRFGVSTSLNSLFL